MDEARWRRRGLPMWLRLRAFGVAEPARVAVQLLRSDPGLDSPQKLLRIATVHGLRHGGAPERDALGAFGVTARQLEVIRAQPATARLLVALHALDRLTPDEVAAIGEVSSLAAAEAIEAAAARLDAAAAPVPDGTQDGDHVSTVTMMDFVVEALDPIQMEQTEQHLAGCVACFERFQAWSEAQESFARLPPPPPPPPPPDRRPLWLAVVLTAAALLVLVVGGAAAVLYNTVEQERVEEVRAPRLPSVTVQADGRPWSPGQPLADGALLTVSFAPEGATHIAVGVRTPDGVELLVAAPVEPGASPQLAPVDLLYRPGRHLALYLLLAKRPLSERDLQRLLGGQLGDDVAATVLRLE